MADQQKIENPQYKRTKGFLTLAGYADGYDRIVEAHAGKHTAMVHTTNSKLVIAENARGVADAVGKMCGRELINAELLKIAGAPDPDMPAGTALLTSAGTYANAGHVIHSVGPDFRKDAGGTDAELIKTYVETLTRAFEVKATALILPRISAGTFGATWEQSTQALLEALDQVKGTFDYPLTIALVIYPDPKGDWKENVATDKRLFEI